LFDDGNFFGSSVSSGGISGFLVSTFGFFGGEFSGVISNTSGVFFESLFLESESGLFLSQGSFVFSFSSGNVFDGGGDFSFDFDVLSFSFSFVLFVLS